MHTSRLHALPCLRVMASLPLPPGRFELFLPPQMVSLSRNRKVRITIQGRPIDNHPTLHWGLFILPITVFAYGVHDSVIPSLALLLYSSKSRVASLLWPGSSHT